MYFGDDLVRSSFQRTFSSPNTSLLLFLLVMCAYWCYLLLSNGVQGYDYCILYSSRMHVWDLWQINSKVLSYALLYSHHKVYLSMMHMLEGKERANGLPARFF